MKIRNVWVDDPLKGGTVEPCELVIEVDNFPHTTIEPEVYQFSDTEVWYVGKRGPFVTYEYNRLNEHRRVEHFATIGQDGKFNVSFGGIFAPIVQVVVGIDTADDWITDHGSWNLPLSRARQLLKKYDPSWRLHLSDRAGSKGELAWKLVELGPGCRWYLHSLDRPCGKKSVQTVVQSGWEGPVDTPVCEQHLHEFNRKQAARRQTSNKERIA